LAILKPNREFLSMLFVKWLSNQSPSRSTRQRRRPLRVETLERRALLAANFAQFVDPNPAPGNQFGHSVVPLSTGNVVITSPFDDAGGTDAGAVYLFNGATGALISTLTGSTVDDRIGQTGVAALANGNFVVRCPLWDSGAVVNAGAATFGNGNSGVSGVVSAANSLVGAQAQDQVGVGVTALANGNYVVNSFVWDNGAVADAGAVTFGNGASGVTGAVSVDNSLAGSTADDRVGGGVTALANGNFVVITTTWDNGAGVNAGAVTFVDGTAGIAGVVNHANSLVGTSGDLVGSGGIVELANGNYVVLSQVWNNGEASLAGAVTFGSGVSGISGVVGTDNSLVGSAAGDRVGRYVTRLTNGNYVVGSPFWAASDFGAVTFGNGTTGISGLVSVDNSLVGSTADDFVGDRGVVPLPNGNYVVSSLEWDNGAVFNAGAVTFGNGSSGITGLVNATNSLVGSRPSDSVGVGGAVPLPNGNYVVLSPYWANGGAESAGAVTFGNGNTGITGVVSADNSLVGSTLLDYVGFFGVTALTNGNYVVSSPFWTNGVEVEAGAVTFGNGNTGITGVLSQDNSLVGSTGGSFVGWNGVTALANGNYVVKSPRWSDLANANVGAVTFGNGETGVSGVVSILNSLIGASPDDQVGIGGVTALANGNYVVASPLWNNDAATDAGAVTFGNGVTGVTGLVSAQNSLVGSTNGETVGSGGVTALPSGNYVVASPLWNNIGLAPAAGAVTFGRGDVGVTGTINSLNSAVGLASNTNLQSVVLDNVSQTFIARFLSEGSGTIRVGSQLDGFNAAPLIGNFGDNLTYRENALPLAIAGGATVTDPDSVNFAGGELTAKLTAGAQPSDRLAIRTAGPISTSGSTVLYGSIVIGTFTGGIETTPLVITLTNGATPGRVQGLLRKITFANVSENPLPRNRTVWVQLTDGDGGASVAVTKRVAVVPVNDAPALDGISGDVGYVRGAAAIPLANTATVTDPDSPNFDTGKLLVRFISGHHTANRLTIGGSFTLSGNDVQLNGITIGTLNTGGGVGLTKLEVAFNATRAIVQQLIRAIRFRTVGATNTTQRVVEFSVTDGDGRASGKVTKTVNVT